MPDITMCTGGDCPEKAGCYRFTATPSPERQAYYVIPPYLDEPYGRPCLHFSGDRFPYIRRKDDDVD